MTLVSRSVPLLGYCKDSRKWIPLAALAGSVNAVASTSAVTIDDPVTFLTYNVFSGSFSAKVPHSKQRTKGALAILKQAQADIIALQEVSLQFERSLRREGWFRKHWHVTSLHDYFLTSTDGHSATSNGRQEDDGCLLAIRKGKAAEQEAHMALLAGSQGKVAIGVDASLVGGSPLLQLRLTGSQGRIVTSHFESLAGNASIRRQQYMQVLEWEPGILLGDFNHTSDLELQPFAEYRDTTADSGATFGELYPWYEGSRDRRKPKRLDLVLAKGFTPLECGVLGDKALDRLRCRQGKGGHCCESLICLCDLADAPSRCVRSPGCGGEAR